MNRRILLAALGLLAVVVSTASGMFHARLVRAIPEVDGTITAPPVAVQLWFNEAVNPRLTSAAILTADSTPVTTVAFIATPDSLNVVGPVGTQLAPGTYRVAWRTMSPDGHVIRGEYRFQLAP